MNAPNYYGIKALRFLLMAILPLNYNKSITEKVTYNPC